MPRTLAGRRVRVRNFISSVNFSANTGRINCGAGTALDLSGNCSYTAWINPRSFGETNFGRILDKDNNSNTGYAFFLNGNTGDLQVNHNNVAAVSGTASFKGGESNGKWKHAAAVYDGANVTFYVNGTVLGTPALTQNPTTNTLSLTIGNRTADNRTFDGFISEVAIYSTNLSQAQVQGIYYDGVYPTANQVGFWRLNEGSGTLATDSSGNGNTGTVITSTYSTNIPSTPRTLATGRTLASGRTLAV